MPKQKTLPAAGFADALLSGRIRRVPPPPAPPAPSKELKRLLPPLELKGLDAGELSAEAYARADEAVRLFGEHCARGGTF